MFPKLFPLVLDLGVESLLCVRYLVRTVFRIFLSIKYMFSYLDLVP